MKKKSRVFLCWEVFNYWFNLLIYLVKTYFLISLVQIFYFFWRLLLLLLLLLLSHFSHVRKVTSVVSDTVRPHRWQPTRLRHPWGSPGNNTGVGCHFLLQCMKVKSESEVAQLCPTLRDPMYCSLAGSSVHGIFQARVLEWGAIASFGNSCACPFHLGLLTWCTIIL